VLTEGRPPNRPSDPNEPIDTLRRKSSSSLRLLQPHQHENRYMGWPIRQVAHPNWSRSDPGNSASGRFALRVGLTF
jgi:hypothetical protein